MKKIGLLLAILSTSFSLYAQNTPKAPSKGFMNGINMSSQTAIGLVAVALVAAGILIYKADNSH